ncbi:MAG TPA: PQQ-binding-like beta-propeller repeat protein [Lacipirellulaceae bacterium]|nr:PQQ-binding-like beta-propeller repeat protein [Lacipirellulaceae bacterium]
MNPPFDSFRRKTIRQLIAPLAGLAIVAVCGVAGAEDWPVVRGDILGSGVAQTTLPDTLEVVWTYKAPDDAGFDATAVIAGGVIYVGDNAGTFHAVRLADGKPVWTKTFEDSSFAAGAAIDKDRLYVGDLNGVVRCLATSDGTQIWEAAPLDGEIYAGPTPYGEDILVTSEAGTLSWLNAADGKQRLPQFKIEAPLRCTPTISAGHVMLSGCDSLLHVVNAADGKETNTVEIDGPTGSTAAMRGERVYFGTEGGTFFAIDVSADGNAKPAVAWTYRDPQRGQPIRTAAAVTDDIVVYGSQGKAIYALNPTNGEVKWKLPTRNRIESSPVIAGNRVVVATAAGKLYLIDAASGEVIFENDFGGSFAASPAVVDGRIIIGNGDGTLYCFGAQDAEKQSATEVTESTEASR